MTSALFGVPTPYVFDVSVYNIFSALVSWRTCICVLCTQGRFPPCLHPHIEDDGITHVADVPSIIAIAQNCHPGLWTLTDWWRSHLEARCSQTFRHAAAVQLLWSDRGVGIWATRGHMSSATMEVLLHRIGRATTNVSMCQCVADG